MDSQEHKDLLEKMDNLKRLEVWETLGCLVNQDNQNSQELQERVGREDAEIQDQLDHLDLEGNLENMDSQEIRTAWTTRNSWT